MPRNRRHLSHTERHADVVTAARSVFAERGYAGATMTEIAERAGLTRNAVRWYLQDKDHALAAVVRDLVDRSLSGAEPVPAADPLDRLLAGMERLTGFRALAPLVLERAPHSPVVADSATQVSNWLSDRVDQLVAASNLSGPDRDTARTALLALLEGEITNASCSLRPDLLRFVITRVLA